MKLGQKYLIRYIKEEKISMVNLSQLAYVQKRILERNFMAKKNIV